MHRPPVEEVTSSTHDWEGGHKIPREEETNSSSWERVHSLPVMAARMASLPRVAGRRAVERRRRIFGSNYYTILK